MSLLSFLMIVEMEKIQYFGYAKYSLNCCTVLFLVTLLALSVIDFTHVDANSICAVPTIMQL